MSGRNEVELNGFQLQWARLASTPYHHVMNPSFLKKKKSEGKNPQKLTHARPPPRVTNQNPPLKNLLWPCIWPFGQVELTMVHPGQQPRPSNTTSKTPWHSQNCFVSCKMHNLQKVSCHCWNQPSCRCGKCGGRCHCLHQAPFHCTWCE